MLSALGVGANVSVKSIPGVRMKPLATRRAVIRAIAPSDFALMRNTHLFLTVLRPGEEPQVTRCCVLCPRSSASSPPQSTPFDDRRPSQSKLQKNQSCRKEIKRRNQRKPAQDLAATVVGWMSPHQK